MEYFSKTLAYFYLKIGKGLTQWDLVPLWPTIKILNKHENVTNIIKIKLTKLRVYTQWAFVTLGLILLLTTKNNLKT